MGLLGDLGAGGACVAPNDFEIHLTASGQEISFVQVGGRSWVRFGAAWIETTGDAGVAAPDGGLGSLELPTPEELSELLEPATVTQESVSGIETTRYSLDKAALEELSKGENDPSDVDELVLDGWVADTGLPLKLELRASGTDEQGVSSSFELSLTLSEVNSGSIEIQPPVNDYAGERLIEWLADFKGDA